MTENLPAVVPAADDAGVTPIESAQSNDQRFGWRHVLAILFAVGVTVGIYLLRDQIERFEEFAYLGAFVIMLLTNATIILPAPGMVFIFALAGQLNPLLVGISGGLGASLGELSGYVAGYGTSAIVDGSPIYSRIARWVGGRFGLGFIALLAFIPNPFFDMAGLVAGTLRVKWWHFLLAVTVGKTLRFILVAYGGALSLDWVERLLM